MKRMIETNGRIEKTVVIRPEGGSINIGKSALGWTHRSDINTLENVKWSVGDMYMGMSSNSQRESCQKSHPSYMDISPNTMTYATSGGDLTDFSTANDWVFIFDMGAYVGRTVGTETLTGAFAKVTSTAISLSPRIELGIMSAEGEGLMLGALLEEGGCKRVTAGGEEEYIVIPSEFVTAPSSNKNAFTIDFTKILGKSFRVYNEAAPIGSDMRYIPMIDLQHSTIADLD